MSRHRDLEQIGGCRNDFRPVRDFSGWQSSKPLQINGDRGYRASLDEGAAYDTERYDLGVIRLPASQTGGTHENPGAA